MMNLHGAARAQVRAQDRAAEQRKKQAQKSAAGERRGKSQAVLVARKVKQPRFIRAKKRFNPFKLALHTFEAAGALAVALAFNCAVFPDAAAQERPLMFAFHLLHVEPLAAQASTDVDPTPDLAQIPDPDPAAVHLLAATTWAEARSEGEEGMRAVAHVIVNRIGPRFGEDISTVVLSPKQFSSWNLHDPNRPLAQNPERYATSGENLETWNTAQEVAREVLKGQSQDPTNGALFYHTRAVHPRWARFGIGIKRIGAHIFYADVPDHPRRA